MEVDLSVGEPGALVAGRYFGHYPHVLFFSSSWRMFLSAYADLYRVSGRLLEQEVGKFNAIVLCGKLGISDGSPRGPAGA